MGERLMPMRLAVVAAVVVSTFGCDGGDGAAPAADGDAVADESSERPRMSDASYDPRVPFETLSDWVSYGDAVVMVTVAGEIAGDLSDELGSGDWPLGQTIVVDESVWRHASAPIPPAAIGFDGALLVVDPGVRPALTLRAATVGDQYLIVLAEYDDHGWAPVAPALAVTDGRVDANVEGSYPYADARRGL